MWILDHLDDLDADFRVFYRIDDIESLTGPRFMALALRVFAYQGVMSARAVDRQSSPSVNGKEVRRVEGTRTAITADPDLSGLVSWGSA
jgi:hypothetical protein